MNSMSVLRMVFVLALLDATSLRADPGTPLDYPPTGCTDEEEGGGQGAPALTSACDTTCSSTGTSFANFDVPEINEDIDLI